MVASVRPAHQRQFDPSTVTDRPEEKELGISARRLCLGDFTLMRTLGTGKLRWLRWLSESQLIHGQAPSLEYGWQD